MTRDQYRNLTEQTRHFLSRLPLGESLLHVPTLIIACVYVVYALLLMINRSAKLWPFLAVPALCFVLVTLLRTLINRPRPYDVFHLPPVGRHMPGKGKSMPSRHAASAVAILMAVLFLHPPFPFTLFLVLLAVLICFLRVATGQHYPSDVLAGAGFSIFLSLLLFPLFESLIPAV